MPIFYLDSGSIDRLEISSSLLVSGSFTLSGSMNSQGGLTGSLLGTASLATTASYVTGSVFTSTNPVLSASYALSSSFAVSASWAPGATSTPTFPYTGSAIISGSLEVTGSFRTLASGTEGGAITGDVNNYLEFYVQNKNTGVSASTDLVAYNDTGNKNQNYVDMGINGTGISPTYSFGKANDAYVYNTGGDLFIGNSTAFYQPAVTSQSLHFFTNAAGVPDITITGSRVGIEKSSSLNATLDVNGNVAITGSLYVSGSHEIDLDVRGNSIFTGSVRVTGSLSTTGSGYFTNKLFVNSTDADLDPTNPESLFVSGSNINVIHGEANINTYAQLNIVNFNNGAASSADIVATNNTGNESGNYVDLGINGSNFGGAVGGVNEAYLFNTGSNFLIGNITRGANANLKFFAGNDATVFPLVVTGSTTIVTGSLLGTASQALTASSVGRLNQDVIITGSLTVSGSAANEVIVLGQTVITGSLIVSGSLGSGVFSKGGTVADFVNLIAISASYYVWRAPYSASVVALYGRRETGSATTAINARRSGSAGYALHTGSNLILTADATWLQANTVANTAYAPGDSLEIIISGSANEQVAVQVDFIKL